MSLFPKNSNPLILLDRWYEDARQAQCPEPEAMTLATATRRGRPAARIVLYKGQRDGVKSRGIFFVSNYDSRKGRELVDNPFAALVFVWLKLERQIRVEGKIFRASAAESDEYWAQRPRASQLSALASQQSREIKSRKELEKRVRDLDQKYAHQPIPRPKNWGGYKLIPNSIEFWQGRPHRLHDRMVFFRSSKSSRWKTKLLSP